MKQLLTILGLLTVIMVNAQNTFRAIILDNDSQEPLIGATATLEGTNIGGTSGPEGLVTINNIPDGKQQIVFSFVGYEQLEVSYTFPLTEDQPVQVLMESGEELEEVVVSATRSRATIEEIPTRTEVLTAEELGEKAVMNSTNIAMLLRESTGILMQQTSANSANQSIRIQGLDGRYTQILKDGFPLFGGFSSGLSIMQIPPLDLKQVEVIKGSASTLYGGGAIAGLVNLVSKMPEEDHPELSLMLNQTSAGGTTVNGFYAQKYGKTGASLYASGNRQQAYDPNDDGFSDIPQVRSLTLNPRFFWYPEERTNIWFGVNTAWEDRIGGDLQVIDGQMDTLHQFTEQNLSKRFSTQLAVDRTFENDAQLRIRNSVSYFDREINIPDFQFKGNQWASFSEATYAVEASRSQWIFGANVFTDHFEEKDRPAESARDYQNTTLGAFTQNTWNIDPRWALESGLRLDHNTDYGTFVLPRFSLLFKASAALSGRLGGGLGYKLPTIFTEDAEALTFQNILPIDRNSTDAERSIGGNFDLNYKTVIGDKLTFSINQLFFYTQLDNALVLSQNSTAENFQFENADGTIDSRGFETNVKLTYGDLKFFLQYAFLDTRLNYNNINNQKPLTPRHNAGAVLMFEQHGKWRVGLETYYTGPQFRSDYSKTRDYWIVGFMVLRERERLGWFINFENFIDTRQSRYQDIVQPPINDPSFAEIWAPTDGFVMNGGFIWKLFGGGEHHH